MGKYCVYLTVYFGERLPRRYLGSSSVERIRSGYRGSVSSKKWKSTWQSELKVNPHLFKTRIITKHKTRHAAIKQELSLQKKYNIIRSNKWINEGYAQPNGYAGRDTSGSNNPGYGKNYTATWAKENPIAASERSKRSATTQWSVDNDRRLNHSKYLQDRWKNNREQMLRATKLNSLKGAAVTKTLVGPLSPNAIDIEYKGKIYKSWPNLLEQTGISRKSYFKYYKQGLECPKVRHTINGMKANGPFLKDWEYNGQIFKGLKALYDTTGLNAYLYKKYLKRKEASLKHE